MPPTRALRSHQPRAPSLALRTGIAPECDAGVGCARGQPEPRKLPHRRTWCAGLAHGLPRGPSKCFTLKLRFWARAAGQAPLRQLSPAQLRHVEDILARSPRLTELRSALCPGEMRDGVFWVVRCAARLAPCRSSSRRRSEHSTAADRRTSPSSRRLAVAPAPRACQWRRPRKRPWIALIPDRRGRASRRPQRRRRAQPSMSADLPPRPAPQAQGRPPAPVGARRLQRRLRERRERLRVQLTMRYVHHRLTSQRTRRACRHAL